MLRFAFLFGALAAIASLNGCGGSSFDTVPVTGKVQLADGGSLKGYAMKSIQFAPNSSNPDARAASGEVQEDGTFTLGTLKGSDGALPGKYFVNMTILKNYPPSAAERSLTWICEPGEVEVKADMEPVVIKVSPAKN